MSTFELIAGILYKGLSIWDHENRTEYLEKLIDLKKGYYEESDKPSYEDRENYPNLKLKDFRDNNRLDDITRELRVLGASYLSYSGIGPDVRNIEE